MSSPGRSPPHLGARMTKVAHSINDHRIHLYTSARKTKKQPSNGAEVPIYSALGHTHAEWKADRRRPSCYNAARTLERTIGEIPPNVVDEILLVDDFSTDETIESQSALA